MAAQKFSSHARSISLPSSSHPLILNVEEHLQRLKSSEGASTSSDSLACQKLNGLKNLYDCLDDVLQLPLSQQAIPNEDVLDGSLRLLDICGGIRDIYSQMRAKVLELESSLRRKGNGDQVNEVSSYMISKKHLNKMISKCYKELKKGEKDFNVNKYSEELPLVKLIKEIQEVSLTVLGSTLSFLAPSKAGSLVSKLLQKKSSSGQHSSVMEQVEVELDLLNKKKSNTTEGLETMESSIQELEEELEIVFRLLLKTRVSLLNILNH